MLMIMHRINKTQTKRRINKIKTRTIKEMVELDGATLEEATRAFAMFEMLRPGLKIKKNGRVDTINGDKTALGLYRAIYSEKY